MTETRILILERDFPHSPDKLWRALTQQHLIAEWLMANDFVAEVGHRFTLSSQPQPGWNGRIDCEVRAIEPGRLLAYSWNTGGPDAAMPRFESLVTLTIESTAAGARLRMEQDGFTNDNNFNGARYGWNHFLDKLVEVAAGLE